MFDSLVHTAEKERAYRDSLPRNSRRSGAVEVAATARQVQTWQRPTRKQQQKWRGLQLHGRASPQS
eukprot:2536213-Pleurochrysis_carterae.AAC.8